MKTTGKKKQVTNPFHKLASAALAEEKRLTEAKSVPRTHVVEMAVRITNNLNAEILENHRQAELLETEAGHHARKWLSWGEEAARTPKALDVLRAWQDRESRANETHIRISLLIRIRDSVVREWEHILGRDIFTEARLAKLELRSPVLPVTATYCGAKS